MNRKRIRDHRRIPFRFRFTTRNTNVGTTTWPMLRRDPETGKQAYNPAVHVSAVIDEEGVSHRAGK